MQLQEKESEAGLVEASLKGDREAFGVLLQRHQAMVVAVCARVLQDMSLAEDAFQEAALTSWLSLGKLQNPASFGAWLAGIAINVSRGWLRRKESVWLPELGGGVAKELESSSGPAEVFEDRETAKRIISAVQQLPEGQRRATLLFYIEGLTHREVAVLLGTSPSAVKTRLQKARAVLRRKLSEEVVMEGVPAISMDVYDVKSAGAGKRPDLHVVILKEKEGVRQLPIFVGETEGTALALELEGVETVRPLTFSFMADIVKASGAQVLEVRIERLHETTFYATVVLETPKGTREVDARPSDALALALALKAPVSAMPEVLEAAAASEDRTAMSEVLKEVEEPRTGSAEIIELVKKRWGGVETTRLKRE